MSRKVLPLTLDAYAALPAPCRSCLFWEQDAVRRRGLSPEEAVAEKEAWISEVLREWGSCGRVVMVDGESVGYVAYAPPGYVPGMAAFPTAPVSPDAVVLTTVWVDPAYAGGGLGRMLIQGMARDLIKRGGIPAVEAFGSTGRRCGAGPGTEGNTTGRRGADGASAFRFASPTACAAPAEFLARVGFKTHRAHPVSPRLRMELSAAVTWRDEVGEALGKLAHVVRPRRAPQAPAPLPRDHPR